MNRLLWAVAIIIVLAGGWYWWSTQSAQPSTDSTGSPQAGAVQADMPQQPAASTVLAVATDAKLGQILTATNGMTVYTKNTDSAGKSTCTGTCATAWPPYTVTTGASVAAVAGLSGVLSTITRDDGTMQVTYNGMPLYFYQKDAKAGDATGEGFGGTWHVVKAK